MKRKQDETTECDTCAGNRQLLDAIRQELGDLKSMAKRGRVLEAVRIEVAHLGPDDYLVFTAPHRLSDDDISELLSQIRNTFSGAKAIILDAGLQLSVVHPDGAQ